MKTKTFEKILNESQFVIPRAKCVVNTIPDLTLPKISPSPLPPKKK